MNSDCTGFRRRVPEPCQYSNSVKRLATFQFSGNRGWVILYVEVLRNVLDRTPGSRLVINGSLPFEGLPKRTPIALGICARDNEPKGDSRSIFALLVQLYCGMNWPGRPPTVYENIHAV